MATIPLPPDFSEFLKLLNSHNIRYLLIGGYAVNYYGHVRSTGDMDIWIEKKFPNAERIIDVLQEFGFHANELTPELFLKKNQVIRMGVPPVRIEILTSISGVEFKDCYKDRVVEVWNDIKVHIISLEKLIQNKRASGRFKDLSDLEHLR